MTEQKQQIGLTAEQARKSGEQYGYNIIKRKKQKPFLRLFLSSFNDPIIKILLVALLINVILHIRDFNPYETLGIAVAVLISTLVSASSEYGSEKAYSTLLDESENVNVTVFRSGSPTSLPSSQIVVGDVIVVHSGEKLRADGYLSHGQITVNQSPLNGESEEVTKTAEKKPSSPSLSDSSSLFSGSLVCCGEGYMTVTSVGENTYYGNIASELAAESTVSPLKEKLGVLAKAISKYGYISAFLVAAADLINSVLIDNGFSPSLIAKTITSPGVMISLLLHALTLALTVVIVAVPEGLPMMIGVVLSRNIKKMKRDHVMVRRPVGIETSGGISILFTDKTGTLTEGKMSVRGIMTGDGSYSEGKVPVSLIPHYAASCLLDTACIETDKGVQGSSSTDMALFSHAKIYSGYVKKVRVVSKTPFSSDKKYSSVTVRSESVVVRSTGSDTVYYKGSPELLIAKCSHYLTADGKKAALDKSKALSSIAALSKQAYRAVAITYFQNGKHVFVGAVLLSDGVRKQARHAVSKLQNAGVEVVMITGDGEFTARAVAEKVGIIKGERCEVITGQQLSRLSDSEVKSILPHIAVIARAYPSDKSRIVRICKSEGYVVGMTGDGINDSPALRSADVGFAVGSGCDVAKEAGDIVITDDDISSIAKAVLYGRTVYKSIKKFLLFQLTMNFCAVGISLIAPLIGCETPVTVIQMLWINIIMDTLAALAFAAEEPREEYMNQPPVNRSENVLNGKMKRRIAFTGMLSTSIMIWFLKSEFVKDFFGFYQNSLPFYCGFFGLFVFTGIFNCFNARTHRLNIFSHLSHNKSFCVIMSAVFGVQLLLMYYGGIPFRCTPLSPYELLFVLLLSLLVIPADLLRKLFDRGEM